MKIEIGKNLTIAVIWLAVAISAFPIGFGAVPIAIFATMATAALVESR